MKKLFTPFRMVVAGITLALFSGPALAASIGLGMLLFAIGTVVRNELRLRRNKSEKTLRVQRSEARVILLRQLRVVNITRLSTTETQWMKARLWRDHVHRVRRFRRPRRGGT